MHAVVGDGWRATTQLCRATIAAGEGAPPVHRRVPLGAGDHGEHIGVTIIVGNLTTGEIGLTGAPPLL